MPEPYPDKYRLNTEEEATARHMDAILSERMGGRIIRLMDPPFYADREGEPITTGLWTVLFARESYRRVAYTSLGTDGAIEVSTIWLGTPFIGNFETMVAAEGHWSGNEMYRWDSLEQALAGHSAIVSELASNIPGAVPANWTEHTDGTNGS